MPSYRRWRVEGGVCFLTVVTCGRAPIFHRPAARRLLRNAMARVCEKRPWTTEAVVLLPDHWHALWRLPAGEADYSMRVGRVKKVFTDAWLALGGQEQATTPAQRRARRRGVWQPRFWEHTIRNATDFKLHLDYIHLNPVKHGLVTYPREWPWSSFRRWVQAGEYEPDWLGRAALAEQVEYYWLDE